MSVPSLLKPRSSSYSERKSEARPLHIAHPENPGSASEQDVYD